MTRTSRKVLQDGVAQTYVITIETASDEAYRFHLSLLHVQDGEHTVELGWTMRLDYFAQYGGERMEVTACERDTAE